MNIANLDFLSSQVDGVNVNRRVTSQRLIEPIRAKPEAPKAKSGILDKFSPAIFVRWQERQCVLEKGIFKYYKTGKNHALKMKGTLNFDLYSCTVGINEKEKS